MGLASKLAAAQSGQPGGQQARLGGGGYPGQGQYQAYPGAQGQPGQYPPPQQPGQQPGYPPQGQPGQYQQGPYGGQPAGPQQIAQYKHLLQTAVQERNLHSFYPPNSPALDQIASRASAQVDKLCAQWRIPKEVGNDIVKLALYDIYLYIDDSGSMQFEENGERIKDLRLIMERVVFAAILFDDDGINMRFMNTQKQLDSQPHLLNNIRSEQQVAHIMSSVQFSGLTPMGTSLRKKVIDEVIGRAQRRELRKPVLVITVTDGQPAGEPQNAVVEAIRYASQEFGRMPQYGPGSIAFQFAQVGNDTKAREFLAALDADPYVGNLVDCTSNYENESAEMANANPPVDLTPELWLIKLLLGSIDSSYDTKDERAGGRQPGGQYGAPGGGPPPGQYGALPPGQYGGPPPGQYGAPPPGQYGAPPPQGQYGGPAPQQGQYGRPSGPPGYPPQQQQQGGYGQQPQQPPRYY